MLRIATSTLTGALALVLGACGSSFPTPTEHLAASQAAVRGATEVGAADEPAAALHLRLAQEDIVAAKSLIAQSENQRADIVLSRATAEAELALSLTRTAKAQAEAKLAQDEIDKMRQGGNGK